MQPVRHAGCNKVYLGPAEGIGDLHCTERADGVIEVVYELDDRERQVIADGGRVMLGIYSQPIPPVSMQIIPEGMCRPLAPHPFKVVPEA